MTLYDYHIYFDDGTDSQIVRCADPIRWIEASATALFRVEFPPSEAVVINMRHVVRIREQKREIEPLSAEGIAFALKRYGGDMHKAAEFLGVSDRTFYRKAMEIKEQLEKEQQEEVVHEP